jgi:hypothetical protein
MRTGLTAVAAVLLAGCVSGSPDGMPEGEMEELLSETPYCVTVRNCDGANGGLGGALVSGKHRSEIASLGPDHTTCGTIDLPDGTDAASLVYRPRGVATDLLTLDGAILPYRGMYGDTAKTREDAIARACEPLVKGGPADDTPEACLDRCEFVVDWENDDYCRDAVDFDEAGRPFLVRECRRMVCRYAKSRLAIFGDDVYVELSSLQVVEVTTERVDGLGFLTYFTPVDGREAARLELHPVEHQVTAAGTALLTYDCNLAEGGPRE